MTHARSAVLNLIEDQIDDNSVPVRRSRSYAREDGQLPEYLLYVRRDVVDWDTSTSSGVMRDAEVIVEICVSATEDGAEAALEAQTEYVENALLYRSDIAGVISTQLRDTEIEFHGEGQKTLAIATLTFMVRYRTLADNVSTLT